MLVCCPRKYEKGESFSAQQMQQLTLTKHTTLPVELRLETSKYVKLFLHKPLARKCYSQLAEAALIYC